MFSKAECLFGCVAFVSLVIFTFFHKIFCVLKTLNGLLASLLGQSINDYCQCCCQHQAKRGEAGLRLIVHHDEFPLISSPCKCHCTGSPKLCLLVIWLPIVFKLGNSKAVKSSVFWTTPQYFLLFYKIILTQEFSINFEFFISSRYSQCLFYHNWLIQTLRLQAWNGVLSSHKIYPFVWSTWNFRLKLLIINIL